MNKFDFKSTVCEVFLGLKFFEKKLQHSQSPYMVLEKEQINDTLF
jgi:hypothetical protein